MKNYFYLALIALLFSPFFIYADNPYEPCFLVNDSVYEVVDVAPEFPGGFEAMKTFIFENIKYPEKARKNKEHDKLFMEFVVNKNGQIESVKSLKESKPYFVEEAKRVIQKMPKWKAGELAGKKVKVKLVLPISFKL